MILGFLNIPSRFGEAIRCFVELGNFKYSFYNATCLNQFDFKIGFLEGRGLNFEMGANVQAARYMLQNTLHIEKEPRA